MVLPVFFRSARNQVIVSRSTRLGEIDDLSSERCAHCFRRYLNAATLALALDRTVFSNSGMSLKGLLTE